MSKAVFSSGALDGDLDDRSKFLLWRDLYVENIGSLDFTRDDDARFSAELEITAFDQVGLGTFKGTICTVQRTAHDLRADQRDQYCLMVNGGTETVSSSHVGREADVVPGAAILISTAERGRLASRAAAGQQGHVWYNILVPGALMRGSAAHVDDHLGVGRSGPELSFLQGYLKFLTSQPGGQCPLLSAHVATTLVDLVSLVIGARGETAARSQARGLRAVRIDACLAHIEKHYATPGFSTRSVARQLGLSVRYIHDLLHSTGKGFAERVLERRLQQARTLLAQPMSDHVRVGDLALSVGFGDVSYFNRCFRKRFGCTPSSMRL